MSLLTMCQNVLAETGWPVPSTISNSGDGTAKQIFAIANTELRAISEALSWPHLEIEYPFSTVAGQSIYLWPVGFRVLAQQSLFDKNEYYGLRGSTGLQFWELLKYGRLASICSSSFRVVYPLGVAGIELTPAPTGVSEMVAVYYTNMYATNAQGQSVPQYAADTDVSKVPERYVELGVKWRFRRAKGLDFSAELAEYNATVQTQFAKYLSQGEIAVGGRRINEFSGITNGYVRDREFGA